MKKKYNATVPAYKCQRCGRPIHHGQAALCPECDAIIEKLTTLCTHPDGHDWEIIWEDDDGRRCCVCIHCSTERIFEQDENAPGASGESQDAAKGQ